MIFWHSWSILLAICKYLRHVSTTHSFCNSFLVAKIFASNSASDWPLRCGSASLTMSCRSTATRHAVLPIARRFFSSSWVRLNLSISKSNPCPTLCALNTMSRHISFKGCSAASMPGLCQYSDRHTTSMSASRSTRRSMLKVNADASNWLRTATWSSTLPIFPSWSKASHAQRIRPTSNIGNGFTRSWRSSIPRAPPNMTESGPPALVNLV